MKIFLIRHGESITNAGKNYDKRLADHAVYLTKKGKNQAKKSALSLVNFLEENEISLEKSRTWVSPYVRTWETANIFNQYINFPVMYEDLCLAEQQFGLFDSLRYEEWGIRYPNEFEHYKRHYDLGGKFWARPPLGESPYDVAIRVKSFFDTIFRDYNKHGIDTLFIFTHGTTLRAFLMQWLHYPSTWFDQEKNPGNCWIRLINGRIDCKYIYPKRLKNKQLTCLNHNKTQNPTSQILVSTTKEVNNLLNTRVLEQPELKF